MPRQRIEYYLSRPEGRFGADCAMKYSRLSLFAVTLCAATVVADPNRAIAGSGDIDLTKRPPISLRSRTIRSAHLSNTGMRFSRIPRMRSGRGVGSDETLRWQQSFLPKLPSAGWDPAICHAAHRRLGTIPAIPRAGGCGRHARGSHQRLHGAQYEWATAAAREPRDEGVFLLYALAIDRTFPTVRSSWALAR